ncbi:MAG TPA: acyl-CoA thioesterase [Nevskiaceae bacterium]|nr:acyl-CoA thioesterase [Nevskiaceae bacterium]
MPEVFRFRWRVRYGECDAQKVVFNARYADYVDLAQTEFLRAIGYDYATFMRRQLDFQVAKLVLEWQGSAYFDDVLEARVQASRVGNTSFTLDFHFVRTGDGASVCRAQGVYVLMTSEPLQKIPVPDDLRAALQCGAPDVVVDHGDTTQRTASA